MRGAARRTKQVSRFRRQRVPVDVASEEPSPEESSEGADEAEKIEVHVHLHRGGAPGSRSKRPAAPRPPLRGALFDWHGHYDPICKRLQQNADNGAVRRLRCKTCCAAVPLLARRCPHCGGPLSRRVLSRVLAAIGLGSVAVMFGLCAHLLGGSVQEAQAPNPVGQWSDDSEYYVVEVPVTPSPFSSVAAPGNNAPTSLSTGERLATR